MGLCERGDDPNFYGLTKIDFRLSKNALWDASGAQWLIVNNESLMRRGETYHTMRYDLVSSLSFGHDK